MSEIQKRNFTFKFLVVGDESVGKTCIVQRLVKDTFTNAVDPTVGVDFITHVVEIGKSSVKLQIWDTAGQERYRSLGRAYYRNAVGVFLVFSINSHKSFESIETWHREVLPLCHPKANVAIIGNKVDLIEERQVTAKEANDLAESLKIPYFETSAKAGTGVSEAFMQITRNIYNRVITNELVVDQDLRIDIDSDGEIESSSKKKGCCK